MNGGDRIASVLVERGVRFLFTLCGGHISPILVGAKQRGIRVVDVRHEVDAVFAADAVSRLTGVPGVAAVTAGPGVTNTITAIKNAQLAQSPLVLLGGATATLLKGRGALQDIDQMALVQPHVKWAASASTVRELVPMLERAFDVARSGVPGPVFVECPIDLLYDEPLVRQWYGASAKGGGLGGERPCASTSSVTPPGLRAARTRSPPRRRPRSRRRPPSAGTRARPRTACARRSVRCWCSAARCSSRRPPGRRPRSWRRRSRRSACRSTWPAAPAACSAPATPSRSATSGGRRCARPTSCSSPASPTTSGSTTAGTSAARPT